MRHPDWLPPKLSYAQVSAYLKCPRKYLLEYVEGLEPEPSPSPHALRRAVRSTIAWAIERWRMQEQTTLEDLKRTLRADLTASLAGTGASGGASPEDLDGSLRLVAAGLDKLAAHRDPDLRSEVPFEVPLWDPDTRKELPVAYAGTFDFAGNGYVGLIKPVTRRTGWRHWSLQLAMLAHARDVSLGRPVKGYVLTLFGSTEPNATIERATLTHDDEVWANRVITSAYRSMTRDAFHPTPSYLCTRCEYKTACRAR